MPFTPERYKLYRQSEEGKATIRRYEDSERGKARRDRYRLSERGREMDRASRVTRTERNKAIIAAAKDVPCADCGNRFPKVCMDFHHVKFPKRFTIGWRRCTPRALVAEIAKCVVICACCHRLRHER